MHPKPLTELVIELSFLKKLIACNTSLLIVRILMFWYQRQSICVKWGKRTSEYFSIIHRMRHPANNGTKICLRRMTVICRHCRQQISVKNMSKNC